MKRAEGDGDAGESSSSDGSSSSDEDRKIPAASAALAAPSPARNSKEEEEKDGKGREAVEPKEPAVDSKAGPLPTNDAEAAGGDSSNNSSASSKGSNVGGAAPEGGSAAEIQLAADGAAKSSGSSASRTAAPAGSTAEAASAAAAAVAADAAKRGPRLTQSLEQLNASAESVRSQKDLSAEEVQREMGVIYSRRKRVRQKLRVESLELKKHTLTQDNLRLRRENAELEGALRGAVSDVATYERRLDAAQTAAFSSGGSPWAAAAAAAAGRLPYPHPAMPFGPSQQSFSALGQHRPFYLPGAASGYPGMGFYGHPGGGPGHNPILNRILPSMMGGPGDPSAPPSNPTGALHSNQLLSLLRGRSGEAAAAESHSPPPPSLPPSSLPSSLQGMDPVLLQRHFLGQSVVPRMEERLDSIPVQDLQELLHYWSGTSPDAASLLDEYLRRRLHHHHQNHQSRW